MEKDEDRSTRDYEEALQVADRTVGAAEKATNSGVAGRVRRQRASILNSLAYGYMHRGEALGLDASKNC